MKRTAKSKSKQKGKRLPNRRSAATGRRAKAVSVSPLQFKKILVPIDFSDCSLKALRYAISLARSSGASLTLLHVIQMYYPMGELGSPEFPFEEGTLMRSTADELERLRWKKVPEEVRSQILVRIGHPVKEITNYAKSGRFDLIVLSTHGRTGFSHVLMGSTTENVVRYAPCPVLTLRPPGSRKKA